MTFFSLSKVFSLFICVVAGIIISFLFIVREYPVVWMYCRLFNDSIVETLDDFHIHKIYCYEHSDMNFVWIYVFNYLRYIFKSGIAGSYNSMLNFLRNWLTVIQMFCHFTFPPTIYECPNFSTLPYQDLLLLVIYLFYQCVRVHP